MIELGEFGVPTTAQLEKINKLAKRRLTADEVFVFPSKLTGDMIIPERYVQLMRETLDVFAMDARKGVSFLIDHSWHSGGLFGLGGRPKPAIPYGRTFDACFGEPTEEGETVSLLSDTYIKRGVEIDGINTDDLIAGIEAGTLFDTSIGFSFNRGICSVCGEEYTSRDCEHYAGQTYKVKDTAGNEKDSLCWIKAYPPAALWENSIVFDGAYPGAGVMSMSARDTVENDHGEFMVVTDLKNIDPAKPVIATYSPNVGLLTMVKKSDRRKVFTPGTVPAPKTEPQKKVEDPFERQKIIESALAAGKKALGASFPELQMRFMFTDMQTAEIMKFADNWRAPTEAKPTSAPGIKLKICRNTGRLDIEGLSPRVLERLVEDGAVCKKTEGGSKITIVYGGYKSERGGHFAYYCNPQRFWQVKSNLFLEEMFRKRNGVACIIGGPTYQDWLSVGNVAQDPEHDWTEISYKLE